MIEKHLKAAAILRIIQKAKKRKDNIYSTFRNSFGIASPSYLTQMHDRLELLDACIARLKNRYKTILYEITKG